MLLACPSPTSGIEPEILSIVPPGDALILQDVLCDSKVRHDSVPNAQQGLELLRSRHVSVVIYDVSGLDDARWQTFFSELSRLNPAPKLIVASRLADEKLWAEVLNLGGFDVILKPYDREEVLRVCDHACRAWKRELEESC